jgi:hypothetical protein
MADVHECEDCGMICDCDGEDMHNPQPDDCVHLAGSYCSYLDRVRATTAA